MLSEFFKYFTEKDNNSITSIREGEKKLGEAISYGKLNSTQKKYIIIGIQESVGVKGNLGIAGTHTAWAAFIAKFLNIQATELLPLNSIHILGNFDFMPLFQSCNSLEDYRESTAKIDNHVAPLIQNLVQEGHIPIIIGGSHANAYPIIKGVSLALNQGIKVVNLDAHADFRPLEGRHSGNPFSYAYHENLLQYYSVIGLHENYNSQNMINEMNSNNNIHYYSWEDIFLRSKITFEEAMDKTFFSVNNVACGIELDMDSIENILSSAMGPTGFTVTQARQYAFKSAKQTKATYLHLCEASESVETGQSSSTVGKLLSYLVTDFIKGVEEQ